MDSLSPLNERRDGLLTVIALPPNASESIMHDVGICSFLRGTNNSSNSTKVGRSGHMDSNNNSDSSLHHNSSSILNNGNTSGWRVEGGTPSGLQETHFNVLSADKSETLSIPPELIEPTAGSRNYVTKNYNTTAPTFAFYLCKMYTSNSTCAHGALCDFIHSRHMLAEAPAEEARVKVIRVHWSTPAASLAEVAYERHEPGFVFHINSSGNHNNNSNSNNSTAAAPRRLVSEHVYRTKGSEDALRSGSMKLLRLCKHYEREKCARGRLCNFIHRVHIAPSQAAHNPASHNAPRGHGGGTHPTISGGVAQQHQHPTVISFGNHSGTHASNRIIVPTAFQPPPPPPPPPPPQQQQQQPRQQQQPPSQMFAQPRGYSFAPIYTSQQTTYVNNPTTTTASSLPSLAMQNPTTFYSSQQQPQPQRHHDSPQHVIPDVQRPPMVSMSTPPDCFLSPLVFTFM